MGSTPSEMLLERVLVVDDNADMADSLREVLEMHGFTVATATSLGRAEEVLRGGFEPTAVLVDLRLGRGETGEQLVERMRRDPAFRDVHIVAISAYEDRLRQLGSVDERLEKPFNLDRLLELIENPCRGESPEISSPSL